MQEELTNTSWKYVCKQCKRVKEPVQAILFSSDDHQEENSKALDPEAILDDKNVQLLDTRCPTCNQFQKLSI